MSVEAAVDFPRTDSATADRRFYFFLTILIALVAITGFAPSSSGILNGTIPSPPLIVHLHAAAMATWLLLLVAQAGLVTAGRRDLHMRLGLASLVLAPALLYDKLRHGSVHRAYWIGLALTVPWLIAAHFTWNSPGWRSVAVALMGAP